MPFIRRKRSWEISGLEATPEHAYITRRRLLAAAGIGAISSLLPGGCGEKDAPASPTTYPSTMPATLPGTRTAFYPAKRSGRFTLDRPITDEREVTSYNNFYEFGETKNAPALLAAKLVTVPWAIEVTGLVREPQTLDLDDLLRRMPIEERLYRFRCVEAWAMAVPWTGFPMKALIDLVEPLGSAKFVRFETANRPDQMPGIKNQPWYPWPYFEALRMDEAVNDLSFLAVGLYGKPMPNQNGAPVRTVIPWKYGYKSIKSIVKIEFVEQQPKTFWETLQPTEYPFESNVDPRVPHPRWSQAKERMLGTDKEYPTQLYNGYGEQVAHLYR